MAGIFDNFNTPIPNLVSGGNLIGSTLSLSDAYNKLFGTGEGGVLDFLNDQQEEIRKRNTQDMTQRMKSLTPDQLKQIEDAGLNPYTDLPAMYGANNGVIVDSEKAFAGADTAGANLITANNNTLNTWLNQLNDQQKADFVAQGGDVPLNMLNAFKQQNNRSGMRFFNETSFRQNADPAYQKGYNTLLDEVERTNANNGTALDRYSNPDAYNLPRNVSPDLEKQLRIDMATRDKNRAVVEAGYAIDNYMKANNTNDFRAAGQALGIPEDIMSSIDPTKLSDMYTADKQAGRDAQVNANSRTSAAEAEYNAIRQKNLKDYLDYREAIETSDRKREATKWSKTNLQELFKNEITAATFEKLGDIRQQALEQGMTNEDFDKVLTDNTAYTHKLTTFTSSVLDEAKEKYKDAFKPDENGKYDLANMQEASSAIMTSVKATLERNNVPKSMIPFMTQQVVAELTNDTNIAKFSNGTVDNRELIKAVHELSSLASTDPTLGAFSDSILKDGTAINPYSLTTLPKEIKEDKGVERRKIDQAVGAVWDELFTGRNEKWSQLSSTGKNYVLYSIFSKMSRRDYAPADFANAAAEMLRSNKEIQGANLLPGALALSKVDDTKFKNAVAPTKEKENSK